MARKEKRTDRWSEARRLRERFYKEVLGMNVTFADLDIAPSGGPECPLVPVIIHGDIAIRFGNEPLDGLTQLCRQYFQVYKYTRHSLDDVIGLNDRDVGCGTYSILTPNRIEAGSLSDQSMILSADEWEERNVRGMTFFERMFFELFFFWRSRGTAHPDRRTGTLCLGSRDENGNVPSVRFSNDRLNISTVHTGVRNEGLFPRPIWD